MKRPWGVVQRIFPKLGDEQWAFIGCSSFEERCAGAAHFLQGRVRSAFFLRFDDSESRFTARIEEKTDHNQRVVEGIYQPDQVKFARYRLLGSINDIVVDIREFVQNCGARLVIDMSAMPKKILCLVLKEAMRSDQIQDLLVTYSIPEDYTSNPLAEDLNPLSEFPGFSSEKLGISEPSRIVASLGYTPFDLAGLQQQLAGQPMVSTLFPFPPGAPRYQRNWQLLLRLFGSGEPMSTPIRVDACDASYAFDVLKSLTNSGQEFAYLLPFGPKPHSLAMLLHALRFDSVIQYTQPKVYNPDYSIGQKVVDGNPLIYVYCIKLENINLYS